MKTAAIRIHALARSLNVEKASAVGHDIGLMVAYVHAEQFPAEVEKLVVMDAFLPGVGDWQAVYNNPRFWSPTESGGFDRRPRETAVYGPSLIRRKMFAKRGSERMGSYLGSALM